MDLKMNEKRNLKVEKPSYNRMKQELAINKDSYFIGVPPSLWEYRVGGYQVLDKYLKEHVGQELDPLVFLGILKQLQKSQDIEEKISEKSLGF